MIIPRLAHAVVLAIGWRRANIAFVAGAASALAMPPTNAWPVLFVTFPILVWLADGSTAGRWSGAITAAVAGWCFGFGYFLVGLYWVGYAFLVDAKTFGWLLPVAVAGLPAYLALYTGLGLAIARLIWVRGPERILALAAAMTAAEWLRGRLLSGFPWNTFGYALTEPLVLAQSVSLTGIWTLTFLCVTICASPAVIADDKADTRHPYRPLVFGLIVLAGLAGYGTARLWSHPTEYVNGVRLRIMAASCGLPPISPTTPLTRSPGSCARTISNGRQNVQMTGASRGLGFAARVTRQKPSAKGASQPISYLSADDYSPVP